MYYIKDIFCFKKMEMIQFLFIKRTIIFNKISNLLSRRVMTIIWSLLLPKTGANSISVVFCHRLT